MERIKPSKEGPSTTLRAGKLVLIIGPSGVGKSVILKRLRASHPEFHFPKSATTRQRREGESNDLYHFVTEEEFDTMLAGKKFLETAIVHGVGRYGTMIDEIVPMIMEGKTVVREVDVQGFDSISNDPLFSGNNHPYELQSIFIVPENTKQLIRRIQKRAPISEDELQRRVASMEKEFVYADRCTNKVINREGELEKTIEEVEMLINR
jgi:guanylate kinase